MRDRLFATTIIAPCPPWKQPLGGGGYDMGGDVCMNCDDDMNGGDDSNFTVRKDGDGYEIQYGSNISLLQHEIIERRVITCRIILLLTYG